MEVTDRVGGAILTARKLGSGWFCIRRACDAAVTKLPSRPEVANSLSPVTGDPTAAESEGGAAPPAARKRANAACWRAATLAGESKAPDLVLDPEGDFLQNQR